MRRLFLFLLGIFLVAPVNVSAQTRAQETFSLVNQVRAEHGLSPFRWNDTLAQAAQRQANYIAANNSYSHSGENNSSPQDRANAAGYQGYVVENFVAGWELTPEQGVTWWINSPVHFSTLTTRRYYQAGVGYAFGNDQHWYVLLVGQPSDQPVAPPPDQPDQAASTDPLPVVVPITLAEPREDGSIVHLVQEGQTLWAIAARYEVRLDTLLLNNNLADDSFVHPGDELLIRLADGQLPPPTPTPPLTHVVQSGETAWSIAADYHISLEEFFWFNNASRATVLRPGDVVTVHLDPNQPPPPTPTPMTTHTVRSGETIYAIAVANGLTVDDLLALNNLTRRDVIHAGDVILLVAPPSPTVPATAVPSPTPQPTIQQPTSTPITSSFAPRPTQTPSTAAFSSAGTNSAAATTVPLPLPVNEEQGIGLGTAVSLLAAVGAISLTILAGVLFVYLQRD